MRNYYLLTNLLRNITRNHSKQIGIRKNSSSKSEKKDSCPPPEEPSKPECIKCPQSPPLQQYTVKTWQPAYPPFPDCIPIRPEPEQPAHKKLLSLSLKASIVGYAIYWTYNEGVWGEPKDTIATYDRWFGALLKPPEPEIPGNGGKKVAKAGADAAKNAKTAAKGVANNAKASASSVKDAAKAGTNTAKDAAKSGANAAKSAADTAKNKAQGK